MKLGQVIEIKTGALAKVRGNGDSYYLQAKDLAASGEIKLPNEKNLHLEPNLENHLLRRGDVLLVAKGSYNPAVLFPGSSVPVVASTTFLILRPLPYCRNKILPEYLTWYLNQPQTQKQLRALAKGTAISSISIGILAHLQIDMPLIKTQQQILKIQELRNKQMALQQEIDRLKQQLLARQLMKAIKGN